MSDIVPDSSDEESKHMHRPKHVSQSTLFREYRKPMPPSLKVRIGQDGKRRGEPEMNKERVARLSDIDGVGKVVVGVARVIS